ncbi:MAG TPA: tetratricopeptide repeat protein [Verrucomicrobiae bacterium]
MNPKLADVILNPRQPKMDRKALESRVAKLLAHREESKEAWWNELAGAYIRLGQSEKAITLLEPVVDRFENDYAIHANLGTAYHMAGRYVEAEKHIARDLELNPEGHFGLEKYHLALLQYLTQSKEYQSRHLFVDELSLKFLRPSILFGTGWNEKMSREEIEKEIEAISASKGDLKGRWIFDLASLKNRLDLPPNYRKQWNLEMHEKLEDGVIYMATLNPQEPACWTMLGVVALKKRDLNLSAAAFEKAVALDSPMKELLQVKISAIREHIKEARQHQWPLQLIGLLLIGLLCVLVFKVIQNLRTYMARRKTASA